MSEKIYNLGCLILVCSDYSTVQITFNCHYLRWLTAVQYWFLSYLDSGSLKINPPTCCFLAIPCCLCHLEARKTHCSWLSIVGNNIASLICIYRKRGGRGKKRTWDSSLTKLQLSSCRGKWLLKFWSMDFIKAPLLCTISKSSLIYAWVTYRTRCYLYRILDYAVSVTRVQRFGLVLCSFCLPRVITACDCCFAEDHMYKEIRKKKKRPYKESELVDCSFCLRSWVFLQFQCRVVILVPLLYSAGFISFRLVSVRVSLFLLPWVC